jgi:hypothetical protein
VARYGQTAGNIRLEVGKWMNAQATFSESGRLDTTTEIWTNNEFTGFTGGTMVILIDGEDERTSNVINNSPLYKYGVDGTLIPGLASRRTVREVHHLSREEYGRTIKVVVKVMLSPKDWLKFQTDRLYYAGKKLIELYNDIRRGSGGSS